MKKNRLLLLSLASLLLGSCGTSSSDPISSDSPDSSSPSSEPIVEKKENVTPSEAFSTLKKLAKATSYEIESGIGTSSAYQEWLTKGYYYNTYLGYGYLLKESFDKQYGESIVYSFVLENGDVKLRGPNYSYSTGKLTYVNDLSSLYVFPSYETEYKNKIDSTSFLVEANGLTYSTNRYIVKLFSAAIGYIDDESLKQISRVAFYKQGTSFGFVLQSAIGNTYSNIYSTQSLIKNIGVAAHPVLDSYVANHYSIGRKSLTDDVLSHLSIDDNERIKLHNEAHVLISNEDQGVNMASELLLSKDKAEITTINPADGSSYSDIIARHEDGYAYEIGYDEKGKVSEKLYEKYLAWDDLVPDLKAKLLEEKECFRLENNEYFYYGRLTNRLKDFFGQMDLKGTPDRMYLTLDSNGLVNGVRFEYPLTQFNNGEESFVYRYVLHCSIVAANDFTALNDLTEKDAIPELDNAFSVFNGSRNYQVTFQDTLSTSPHESITYTDGIYYDEEVTTTFGGIRTTASGYYSKSNKAQSFIMTEDGTYYARSALKEESVAELIPQGISSALFLKEGDSYVLRDHVLPYVSKGLPLNYNASLMFPRSASFLLGEDGLLSSLSFTYDWDILNSRSEVVSFNYDDVSLPTGAKEKLLALGDFVTPASWSEEDITIANNFESLYGEEARNIPYVYMEGAYKQWQSDYSISDSIQLINKTTSGIDTSYYQAYRQALLDNGFELALTPTLPGAEEYNKGKIKVRLAKILRGGFYFSLNS